MPLVARSFQWLPNVDGTLDGRYPAGDKPPGAASVAWGSLTALATAIGSRTTGTPFSQDIRQYQYLTGTNAATATLSVATVSGDDAITEGWAISGDNLEHPGSGTGSGYLRLGATVSGNTVYSDPIAWAWVGAISDALAPCIPTGGVGVAGAGEVTFSCDIPGDPHDGTNVGALTSVQLRISGATEEEITVAAGLSPSWTLTNIGTSTPSPSFNQTGQDWALSGGGAGFDSANDSFPFSSASISGDFRLTTKITAFSSAFSQFSKCGLMVRETATAGSKLFAVYAMASGGLVQCKARTSTGGSATNQAVTASAVSLPAWLQIERSADSFTARYSTDGITWIDFLALSITMATTIAAGFFVTSQSAGNAVSASITQVWANNAGRVTFAAVSSASAITAKFRAKDAANNLSAESASITVTPLASVVGKKWQPGHYYKADIVGSSITANWVTSIINSLNTHVAGSVLKGIELDVMWAVFEPDNAAWDFSAIDTLLAWCVANGKYLNIQIADRRFNSTNRTGIIPADLMSAHLITGLANNGTTRSYGAGWRGAYMDRFIRFWEEFASRYDSDVNLQMVSPEESALGVNWSAPAVDEQDATRAGLATQLGRLYDANGLAWSRTVWSANINSLTGYVNTLMERAYQNGLGWTTPDAVDVAACRTFRGIDPAAGNEGVPVRDYRGLMAANAIASAPVLGGKDDNGPPSNVINWAQTQSLTHLSWVLSRPSPNTKAQILSAIGADPNLYTTCPTVFSSCDV